MKTQLQILIIALAFMAGLYKVSAQGTAFAYQSKLNVAGNPANGIYDLRFTVFDAATNGNLIAGPLVLAGTGVTNGLFSVNLDFGSGVFTGPARWLQLDVQTNGGGSFTTLYPLEPLLPVPYAIMAGTASNLVNTLPLSQLPAAVVTNNQSGVTINGIFTGDGSGLTNLNVNLPAIINQNSLTVGGTNEIAPLTVPPTLPTGAIGSVGTGHLPQCVAVSGRYAYVVNEQDNTLQVFDASTPSAPALVGSVATGNQPYCVTVSGRYVYVGLYGGSALQIFDASTPAAPALVGSLSTGNQTTFVAVSGHYAYVVNFVNSILQIIDVSIPSAPVTVGSLATEGGAYCVAMAGRYAYVVNEQANTLQIIDVSTPTAPVSVGTVGTGANPESVVVSGRYAYVANPGASTLQIFDVSTPSAPVLAGSVATGGSPETVVVAGRYAYVVSYDTSTLQVYDVSNPSAPASVGAVGTGNHPRGVAVSGRYAYVVNMDTATLQIFDLGGAYLQQLEAGTIETGTLQTRDTAKVGNNLDVAGGLTVSASARISGGLGVDSITASNIAAGTFSGNGAGLTNLNVTLPAAISQNSLTVGGTNVVAPLTVPPIVPADPVGSYVGTGNAPDFVVVNGRYAYIIAQGNILQVYDVSTPSAPAMVGSVNTATSNDEPLGLAVAGRYAYEVNGAGHSLQIFDVGDPAAPVNVSSVVTSGFAVSVAVAGRFAYVLCPEVNILQVFDVTTPSAPVSIGSVSTGDFPHSIAVAGHYAYVTEQGAGRLEIFDVNTPSAPILVGSVATAIYAHSVAVSGSYAYLVTGGVAFANNTNMLQIIDVSNPSAPVIIGSAATDNDASSIAVSGRYAYVANSGVNTFQPGVNTLQIFDVSNPSAPVSIGSVGTGNNTYCAAISGRYAYVVNANDNTLQAFDLGGAYIQQFEAGTIETGTLQTRDTATVGNNLDVRGGLTVSGSARITGGLGADFVTATTLTQTSDRNSKEHFTTVNPADILDKVAGLPITEWNFKTDAATRHLGPMAQDFHSAFNLGMDDKHITTVDEEGVALAAIQGLNQKLNETRSESQAKDALIQDLQLRMAKLEQVIKSNNGGGK